jgi:acetylornithine deacetylase/succinyl-diaminopimelate desuccinylase-like protein
MILLNGGPLLPVRPDITHQKDEYMYIAGLLKQQLFTHRRFMNWPKLKN